jgi:general secretion pathway protein G
MRCCFAENPDGFPAETGEGLMPFSSCARSLRACIAGRGEQGYSLVELLIIVAIIVTLVAIAIPIYSETVNHAKVVAAIGDISNLQAGIKGYYVTNRSYPESLEEVNEGRRMDPWGQPYQYLKIAGANSNNGKGEGGGSDHVKDCRKDKNLVPLNRDFDLYSMGPDKESVAPITAKASRDDIIRANNGAFIGIAKNY